MAYQEDLTLGDLEECRRALSIVSKKKGEYSPRNRNGFELASACFGLLEDVRLRIIDRHPKLGSAPYHKWGPGYFNDGEGASLVHALGWDIYKRTHKGKALALRIRLPCGIGTPLTWRVQRHFNGFVEEARDRSAKRMLSRDGTVDQDAIVRWVDGYAKKWKLV